MLFFHFTTLRLLSPLYFPFYTYLLSLSNITFQLCLDALEKQDVAEDMTVSAEVEEMNVSEAEELNVSAEVEVEVMIISVDENVIDEIAENAVEVK